MTNRAHSDMRIRFLATITLLTTGFMTARGDDSTPVHCGVRFLAPDVAELRWETNEPTTASVAYGTDSDHLDVSVASDSLSTAHRVLFKDLQPQQVYYYRITNDVDGKQRTSETFQFDNGMNYTPPDIPVDADANVDADAPDEAETDNAIDAVIGRMRHAGGYAVVGESLANQWAPRIASQSSMTVVAACEHADRMSQLRRDWYEAGAYGIRLSAQPASEIPASFANLAIVSAEQVESAQRWLSPIGILVSVGRPPESSKLDWTPINENLHVATPSDHTQLKRWDHQYGTAANQSFSGETLDGTNSTSELEVRWLGRPGADFGIDRNPRMPAPLAVGGRLFHQGMNRMIALDAFNGAVLWSLEMPQLRRVNIPRDSANWSADDDHVYAATGDRLWVIDAATGELKHTMTLPEAYVDGSSGDFDWGYIANTADTIVGTAVIGESQYEEYWAKPAWYDGMDDDATAKVCGRAIVAYDKQYGDVRWQRDVDAVIHSTMTIADDRLLFVEIKNAQLRELNTGKLTNEQLGKHAVVVCVDLKTGRELWTHEAPEFSPNQVVAFGMSDEKQFVLETSSDNQFHFSAFDLVSGKPRWEQSTRWPSDNHGAHMQHAVLMNGKVFVQPHILDAETGEILATETLGKRRGCATPVGTGNTIIYRGGDGPLSFWSLDQNEPSEFTRLRPSCWLSTIPAQGMLFSPEAGGGCSCGGWMECSIGFAPKKEEMSDDR